MFPIGITSPYSRYANLLVNNVLTDVNQLWTSDLTYFHIGAQTPAT